METLDGRRGHHKHQCRPSSSSGFNCLEKERTYCLATVGDEARRLLEGFLQVVLESLVLVLLGPQLHEFP